METKNLEDNDINEETGACADTTVECSDKKVEKKAKRLSRKKSKDRSRKKRSAHSKGQSDSEINCQTALTDDKTSDLAGKLTRHHSMPSKSKSRTTSGSRRRLSGWFKRKNRSGSRDRSRSETDIIKGEGRSITKTHESAEDIKRTTEISDSDRYSYLNYDATKQPRDRLRRMTVRDAVKERRIKREESGKGLSSLDKHIAKEEMVRTASLPDISVVGPGQDGVDSALIRGSVTLPRGKKSRKGKKSRTETKIGRVSIEVDSEDSTHSEELPSATIDRFSKETLTQPSQKQDGCVKETCHSVLVHGDSNGVSAKPEETIPAVNSGISNHNDTSIPIVSDRVTKQNNSTCDGEGKCRTELKSTENEANKCDISESDTPKMSISRCQPKAVSRWQSAIKDVQKQRRKESLSLFLVLSRSMPRYSTSSMAWSKGRDLSPGKMIAESQSRDQSPGKISRDVSSSSISSSNILKLNSGPKDTFPQKPNISQSFLPYLSRDKSRDPSPKARDPSSSEEQSIVSQEDHLNKKSTETKSGSSGASGKEVQQFLCVPHHIDRSLSEGEATSNLEKISKPLQRSISDCSEPIGEKEQQNPGESKIELKNVPVMGTSVQQRYRRTFSPKRQTDNDATDDSKTVNDNRSSQVDESKVEENVTQGNSESKEVLKSVISPDLEGTVSPDIDTNQHILGENSEMSTALENRGRESQRRRYKSRRSFRRKGEEMKATCEEGQKEKVKSDEVSPIVDTQKTEMYDKSTQTSDLDLSEKWTKKTSKLKKNNNNKKKKKFKDIVSLVSEQKVEDLKSLKEATSVDESTSGRMTGSKEMVDKQCDDKKLVKEGTPEDESSNMDKTKAVDEQSSNTPAPPKPKKLSFAAIIMLKTRMANRKKRKEAEALEKEKEKDDTPYDIFTIENEINLSKLAEIKETDILDDEIIEPDIGTDLPRKQLRFDPITSEEPIQSEEPLPPLPRPAGRRMTERRGSSMREKRKKVLHCCKKFTAFLFSHIGLCSLVVAYTIMGGFIFKAIEAPFEDKMKTDIRQNRQRVINKLLQHAVQLQMSEWSRDNFTDAVEVQLKAFQKIIHKETKENGWDGKDKSDSEVPEMQWSFASSLLYAITVMTTIGYGHVAPKTNEGRIVTIGYAVLGIPLTLLCLTNIGDVMATGFRLLYGKVCCGVCCKLFRPRRRRLPDLEKGLGKMLTSEEEEDDKPKEVIRVPTSLCILLIAGYIFAGALLFALWEKWDYLTGSYFCFITLSTIGFGDIVPGTDLNAWSQEEKLVLCAMYLVFGLSLIAMCFNLVQEDVKAKCRWLGMKIGIIDKPESSV